MILADARTVAGLGLELVEDDALLDEWPDW